MTGALITAACAAAVGRRRRTGKRACFQRGRGIAHRHHRADDRHHCAGRQGHGRRPQHVSRGDQRHLRRRQGEGDRRGQPSQAGHRGHQGQEAHPAGQGAHAAWRRAGHGRLCACAGEHQRQDRLYRLRPRGRRSHPARSSELSLPHPHRLDELAAASPARAMGVRAGLQEDRRHRGRLRVRARVRRRLPEGIRGLRRQDHPEDLASVRHQGLRTLYSDHQGGRRCDLHAHGRADGGSIPEAVAGRRHHQADRRRRHQLRRVRFAGHGRRGDRRHLGAAIQRRAGRRPRTRHS